MRKTLALLIPLAVGLAACTDHQVTLSYELEPGRILVYELRLEADITRTLQDETRRQRVEAGFQAAQEILSLLPGPRARARLSLTPTSLTVDGEPMNIGEEQDFLVILGPDGGVLTVEEAVGESAEPLGLVGIERLLPRLRPVLPPGPVVPGEEWRSDVQFEDEDGTFMLSSRSRLAELGITGGMQAALVRTTYRSPVDREELFANAVADLSGRDVGAQEAWFALDGFLIRASGDSVGRYRVTFRPPGGRAGLAPVEGGLVVRLHTEMRLAE